MNEALLASHTGSFGLFIQLLPKLSIEADYCLVKNQHSQKINFLFYK